MKNLFFSLFTLFLCIFSGYAQTKDSSLVFLNGRTRLGIKAGFTQAWVNGKDTDSLSQGGKIESILGFHLGIIVNSMIGKHFWLKHELLLTQKGANIMLHDAVNGTYASSLRTLSLDLFPISPAFHYKGFQIYAGPYLSLLLDGSIKRKDPNGNTYTDHSIYGDDTQSGKYLQKMDAGISAGVEYEFAFGLNFGIKYVKGFVYLMDYANTHTFKDNYQRVNIFNEYINFSVGYNFGRRKAAAF